MNQPAPRIAIGSEALRSAKDVLAQLRSEDNDSFLYRGQARRFSQHHWSHNGSMLEIEPVYPADFRFITRLSEPSIEFHGHMHLARQYGRSLCRCFAVFLAGQVLHHASPWAQQYSSVSYEILAAAQQTSGVSFLTGLSDAGKHFTYLAWSLAQHYCVATALLDVTSSLDVATWFALNNWHADQPVPQAQTQGVIYRLKRDRLLLLLGAGATSRFPSSDLSTGLIDIQEIPEDFAMRPRAQRGASLIGFDNPTLVAEAFETGVIESFPFAHQEPLNLSFARNELIPPNDPFLPLAKRFSVRMEFLLPRLEGELPDEDKAAVLNERFRAVVETLGVHLRSAQQLYEAPFDSQRTAVMYRGTRSFSDHEYPFVFVIIDVRSGALAAAVTAETSDHTRAMENPDSQIIALYGGNGRLVLDVRKPASPDEFKRFALDTLRQKITFE